MWRRSLLLICFLLNACGNGHDEARRIADLQAKSDLGSTSQWPLDPALAPAQIQEMRDRAYIHCLSKRPSDRACFFEQDKSLVAYANAFRMIRALRSDEKPARPFEEAHLRDVTAFDRVHRYCLSVYEDAGARDARSLGPCMSASFGADFFGIIPVP